MRFLRLHGERLCEGILLVFIAGILLWKGGKTLEATWLLAGIAVLVTFVRHAIRRQSSAPPLTLWLPLMLFCGWTVLSFAFSSTQNYGLDEVLRDASCVLIFLWMWGTLAEEHSGTFLPRLVSVLAWATLAACVVGAAVYVLQPVNRFVGTFFDFRFTTDYWPNAWGQYLLLAWPVVTVWAARFSKPLRALAVGVVLGCLLLSYSRGSFLVFIGQAGLWALLLVISRARAGSLLHALRAQWVRWMLTAAATVIVALGVFAGINAVRGQFHEIESVAKKATFTASEGASSISERRDFWGQALQLSRERPLVGYGPYSFRFVQPRLQTEVFATSDHPHNVFLKLAAERGWPAMLFFVWLIVIILFPALWNALRPASGPDSLQPFSLPILVAVIGVLAHNLIDYNLQFVAIALPFWLFLAILSASPVSTLSNTKYVRILSLLIAVAVGCTAIWEGRMLVLSSLGRHAEAAGDSAAALAWYDKARGELFSRDMHLSRAALYLSHNRSAEASAALDDYARANAEDARLWILRARAALAIGDTDAAAGHYGTAMKQGKFNHLEPLEGVLTILSMQSATEDLGAAQPTIFGIYWQFGNAILQNAHFIALSDNVETFARVSALLQTLYPDVAGETQTFTAKVLEHAEDERSRARARPPSLLW